MIYKGSCCRNFNLNDKSVKVRQFAILRLSYCLAFLALAFLTFSAAYIEDRNQSVYPRKGPFSIEQFLPCQCRVARIGPRPWSIFQGRQSCHSSRAVFFRIDTFLSYMLLMACCTFGMQIATACFQLYSLPTWRHMLSPVLL